MDVQMPGVDGLTATRRIVSDPALTSRVLVLTTFDRDDYLFQALDAGASGFILKNDPPEALVEAVQIVARGDALLSPAVTRRVIARASSPRVAESAAPRTPSPDLTERESEVLGLVAQGLSNAEIAARLGVGEATVKTHVSSILGKLGVRDRVGAVIHAFAHGYADPGSTAGVARS